MNYSKSKGALAGSFPGLVMRGADDDPSGTCTYLKNGRAVWLRAIADCLTHAALDRRFGKHGRVAEGFSSYNFT